MAKSQQHLAVFFTPSRVGGGVGRSMLTLASAFAERDHRVDLILSRAVGPYLQQVPDSVNLIVLQSTPGVLRQAWTLAAEHSSPGSFLAFLLLSRTFRYLPDLVCYLQRQRPTALFSAKTYPNLAALWARRLTHASTRIVVSERTNLSHEVSQHARGWQWHWRFLPRFVRRVYPWADAVVTVSRGVADDLALTTGLPRASITTIYNPVVNVKLQELAQAPLAHPWFTSGNPPVVLGAGRLEGQKDFPTLLKAFVRVRAKRDARLLLLGEGKDRSFLENLARNLGIAEDVEFPGFSENPFAYMARAAVFVLSSTYEGLPGVLIQAMACGCPVVSTDCPSGPAEILDGGAYGPLTPVGDVDALTQAILTRLDAPRDSERLRARASLFSVEHAVDQYLRLINPPGQMSNLVEER